MVHVGFAEVELREQMKQAGGKWNRSRKVWELRYEHVVALKLAARIVEEKASNSTRLLYFAISGVNVILLGPIPSFG